jgi:hypothetical protein
LPSFFNVDMRGLVPVQKAKGTGWQSARVTCPFSWVEKFSSRPTTARLCTALKFVGECASNSQKETYWRSSEDRALRPGIAIARTVGQFVLACLPP